MLPYLKHGPTNPTMVTPYDTFNPLGVTSVVCSNHGDISQPPKRMIRKSFLNILIDDTLR